MENFVGKIVVEITEQSLTFIEQIMDDTVRQWGFDKADLEKRLLELEAYHRAGLTPEEVLKLRKKIDVYRSIGLTLEEIILLKAEKNIKQKENERITAEDLRNIFSQIYNNQCKCLEETSIVYQAISYISRESFRKRREEIEKQIPIDADPVTADYIRVNK